jgi:hypothetical protein
MQNLYACSILFSNYFSKKNIFNPIFFPLFSGEGGGSLFHSIWGVGLRNGSYLANRVSFWQSESSAGKKNEIRLAS